MSAALKKYTYYENGMYISEGTADELAKTLNVKPNTIYKHFSRTKSGASKKIEVYEVLEGG